MAVDELSVVLKARELINKVGPSTIPVAIKPYVEQVGAVLHVDHGLAADEAGYAFEKNGKHHICINGKDSEERQRFTACHEVAHIALGLPSDHKELPWWSYAKRSPNEIFCDVFAAELLLPYKLFKPLVDKTDISLAAVDHLACRFVASNMATGSRFATLASAPCAFVLSERGKSPIRVAIHTAAPGERVDSAADDPAPRFAIGTAAQRRRFQRAGRGGRRNLVQQLGARRYHD
jgi:hypothetical protein